MRVIVAAVRHRNAAGALVVLGIMLDVWGTPVVDFGEDDTLMRMIGFLCLFFACFRLMYLALLEEDAKYGEGHRRGFHLGRSVAKPVIVDLRRRMASDDAANAARCRPTPGRSPSLDRPEVPGSTRLPR